MTHENLNTIIDLMILVKEARKAKAESFVFNDALAREASMIEAEIIALTNYKNKINEFKNLGG